MNCVSGRNARPHARTRDRRFSQSSSPTSYSTDHRGLISLSATRRDRTCHACQFSPSRPCSRWAAFQSRPRLRRAAVMAVAAVAVAAATGPAPRTCLVAADHTGVVAADHTGAAAATGAADGVECTTIISSSDAASGSASTGPISAPTTIRTPLRMMTTAGAGAMCRPGSAGGGGTSTCAPYRTDAVTQAQARAAPSDRSPAGAAARPFSPHSL